MKDKYGKKKSHMEMLLKQIRAGHCTIQKVKSYLNLKSLQLLYHSIIQSFSIVHFFLVFQRQNADSQAPKHYK